MTISLQQVSAKFLWTGVGQGPVSAGAAVAGFSKPTSAITNTGYLIENPDDPTERENGKGNWDPSGGGTLTRVTVLHNGISGAKHPSAGLVDFQSPGTKIVTLMSMPDDFGTLAGLAQVDTAQIVDNAVTFAKVAHSTANSLAGYDGTGAPAGVSIGAGLSLSSGSLSATGGGAGEANTGANVATNGVGVFDAKVGVQLQFRGIASLSPGLTVALDDAQNDIDLNLVFANQAEAAGGLEDTKPVNSLGVAQAIAAQGGAGAPLNASYLVLGANTNLSAERILTPQHSLVGADDGAGAGYRVSLVNDAASPGNSQVYGTTGLGVKGWRLSPGMTWSGTDPTGADDATTGHRKGHLWMNDVAATAWIMTDDSVAGAAVWADIVGGGGHIIQEDGTPLTARGALNFGAGLLAEDDAGNSRTNVSVVKATQLQAETGTDDSVFLTALGGEQQHAARQAKARTGFNPAAVLVDDDADFDTYVQSGPVGFAKATSGTFRRGKTIFLVFDSDGSALTWTGDFENFTLGAPLPVMLPDGLHVLGFRWNSHRLRIQVAVASLFIDGAVLGDYSELVATQSGVTGAVTLSATRKKHSILHGAGNITPLNITGWPAVSGYFSTMTVDWKQDAVGGRTVAVPTGGIWAGGTPTFDTAANKTNRVTYTTENAGTTVVMHYGGSF